MLDFLQSSYSTLKSIQASYFELDSQASDPDSDDSQQESARKFVTVNDFEEIGEVRQSEEVWMDLFYYALDLTAANIEHIAVKYQKELL